MAISFNPVAGRYIDESGKFIKRSEVVAALDEEVLRLQSKLATLQGRLAKGEISLGEFSRLARSEIKPALARSAMLGSGGREAFLDSNRQIGTLGAQAKLAYGSLDRLSKQLANGELTLGQAIDRSRRLANFAVGAFSRAEQLSRVEHGFMLAERLLDPGSKHCPDCPAYETAGFVPIDQVTPVGMGCRCGGRCRCIIRYRRGTLADLPDLSQSLVQSVLDNQAKVSMGGLPGADASVGTGQVSAATAQKAAATKADPLGTRETDARRAKLLAVASGSTKSLEPYRNRVLDKMVDAEMAQRGGKDWSRNQASEDRFGDLLAAAVRRNIRNRLIQENTLEVVAKTKQLAQDEKVAAGKLKAPKPIPEMEAYRALLRLQSPPPALSFAEYVKIGEKQFQIPPSLQKEVAGARVLAAQVAKAESDVAALKARRAAGEDVSAALSKEVARYMELFNRYDDKIVKSIAPSLKPFHKEIAGTMSKAAALHLIDAAGVTIDHSTPRGTVDALIDAVRMTQGQGIGTLRRIVYTDPRAWASQGYVNTGDPTKGRVDRVAFFHEYGHHIEYSQDLYSSNGAIIRGRATGPAIPLGKPYGDDEIYLPDKWIDQYTGKDYSVTAGAGEQIPTEVLSMGFQHFENPRDMASLLVQDPDHFYQTLGIIRRP